MDNITFRPDTRQQIILAAFTAAGPGADDAAIASQIERIADAMLPGSAASHVLDEIEHYWSETVTEVNKPFLATILYVDMEATSQRPVLALKSAPNRNNPDGKYELIKLDMARGRNEAKVRAQANAYARMLGHQVAVTRMNEKTSDGRKASVLRSAVSQGLNPEFHQLHVAEGDVGAALDAKLTLGARQFNWAALGDSDRKIASKLENLARRTTDHRPQAALVAAPPRQQRSIVPPRHVSHGQPQFEGQQPAWQV